MASVGTVLLSEVWTALDACLPGWRKVKTKHHWRVYPPANGPFCSLQLGGHGARNKVRVQRGRVKYMFRQFKALECALKQIEGL